MDRRIVVPLGLALGAARFVLLMLASAGFLAMYGAAATDPAGLHHSPVSMQATRMEDPARPMGAPVDVVASASGALALTHDGGRNGHDMAAACLFVLLGVLAAVALHALHNGLLGTRPAARRTIWQRRSPARPPPQPIFLSLCVFRL